MLEPSFEPRLSTTNKMINIKLGGIKKKSINHSKTKIKSFHIVFRFNTENIKLKEKKDLKKIG